MTKTFESLETFCDGLNSVITAVITAKSLAQQILDCWQELEKAKLYAKINVEVKKEVIDNSLI